MKWLDAPDPVDVPVRWDGGSAAADGRDLAALLDRLAPGAGQAAEVLHRDGGWECRVTVDESEAYGGDETVVVWRRGDARVRVRMLTDWGGVWLGRWDRVRVSCAEDACALNGPDDLAAVVAVLTESPSDDAWRAAAAVGGGALTAAVSHPSCPAWLVEYVIAGGEGDDLDDVRVVVACGAGPVSDRAAATALRSGVLGVPVALAGNPLVSDAVRAEAALAVTDADCRAFRPPPGLYR